MAEKRKGRQTPTLAYILPYTDTKGKEAVDLYNSTGQKMQEWQELLIYDIEATNEDGLWTHTKIGGSIPRRNGKGEVIADRELDGIINRNEQILHTAHLTSTSSAASKRLARLLKLAGYEEVIRVRKDIKYEKAFSYSKQYGLEKITILGVEDGGSCSFRTRTSAGGLGEGFDTLIIDEAQEYTKEQESTLQYTVSQSKNPQIIYFGTPNTAISKGTVFNDYRNDVLKGKTEDCGWFEWSVQKQSDVNNIDLWYETNPGLGYHLSERNIRSENKKDIIDYNIQRLGWWPTFSQDSEVTEEEWNSLKVNKLPKLEGKLFVGIKYGKSSGNVALSVAVKTKDGNIYVECIDCREIREGNNWIINFLKTADIQNSVIDGKNGQVIIKDELSDARIRNYSFPKVEEVIEAYATFEKSIASQTLRHGHQPSVFNVVTNIEKRAIGTNGGFGYNCIKDGCDISILDSIVLAYWACAKSKKTRSKQKVSC